MSTNSLDFKNFNFEKIINQDNNSKFLTLLGTFNSAPEKAVVVLSKSTFNEKADWGAIMNGLYSQNQTHDNDIYKKFELVPSDPNVNQLNNQTIYPADAGIIGKYSKADYVIFCETPEFFKEKSSKFIESIPESKKQWVYNILYHGYEAEKVVYQDPDPNNGFMLVVDYGMSAEQPES